jgi:hypothetical protein
MKTRSISVILLGLLLSLSLQAQDRAHDLGLWNWLRFEGSVENPDDLDPKSDKIAYSLEFQFRLKDNVSNFGQAVLIPMAGYRVSENLTLWLGIAHVEQSKNGHIYNEQRLFQMVSFSRKLQNAPVVFVSNTRIEQRVLNDYASLNIRFRQMLRISVELFKFQGGKLSLFFQDEYFHRLNHSPWAGRSGFNQNRLAVGLDIRTHDSFLPATYTVSYINNLGPERVTHAAGIGVRVNLPRVSVPKKKRPRP